MKTELKPKYENVKSFYRKAYIKEEDNKIILISYTTEVLILEDNKKPIVKNTHSNTTLRHIKEFLKQYGFKAENKRQILKDYKEDLI